MAIKQFLNLCQNIWLLYISKQTLESLSLLKFNNGICEKTIWFDYWNMNFVHHLFEVGDGYYTVENVFIVGFQRRIEMYTSKLIHQFWHFGRMSRIIAVFQWIVQLTKTSPCIVYNSDVSFLVSPIINKWLFVRIKKQKNSEVLLYVGTDWRFNNI